jgi:hypothetical protein
MKTNQFDFHGTTTVIFLNVQVLESNICIFIYPSIYLVLIKFRYSVKAIVSQKRTDKIAFLSSKYL